MFDFNNMEELLAMVEGATKAYRNIILAFEPFFSQNERWHNATFLMFSILTL